MENNKYSYCNIAELTHVGMKRKANEDWLGSFECQNGLVAVVCDGMGGHVGGAVASHTAVEAIEYFLKNNYIEDPRVAIGQAIEYANKAILSRVAQQPELNGMGATCVMVIVRDGLVYVGSVGDSRVYYISGHIIRQLTKDQSFVQLLVDRGELTPEQAEHHPRKNEILNALGLPNMTPAVVLPDAISPTAGDCLLLCSDGLSGMVDDKQICKIVSDRSVLNQQQRVEKLIATANANGGLDNITAQLVEFSVTPGAEKKPIAVPPMKNILMGVLALVALVVVIGVGYWFINGDEKEEVVVEQTTNNATPTKVYTSPSIKFERNNIFAEFKAGPEPGTTDFTLVMDKGNKKDTRTFNIAFTPDSIEVPGWVTRQEDSDKLILRFVEKLENLDTVTCTFKGKDCVWIIKIPVELSVVDNNKRSLNKPSTVKTAPPVFVSNVVKGSSVVKDTGETAVDGSTHEELKDSTNLVSEYVIENPYVKDGVALVVKFVDNANAVQFEGNTMILPGRYYIPKDGEMTKYTDYMNSLVTYENSVLTFKFAPEEPESKVLDINLKFIDRQRSKNTVSTKVKIKIKKD